MKASLLIVLASLVFLGAFLYLSQPDASVTYMGKPITESFESHYVGDKFHVVVYLPNGYKEEDSRRYPVVYQLDGDYQGKPMARLAGRMSFKGTAPPLIVVAVGYYHDGWDEKRNRDYSYPPPNLPFGDPRRRRTGGGLKFYRFLEHELVPYIDSRYKTVSSADARILCGHTLGGYFALFAMFRDIRERETKPALFSNYILSRPSLCIEADPEYLFTREMAVGFAFDKKVPVNLFMAYPMRYGKLHNLAYPVMTSRLATWKHPGFRFKSITFEQKPRARTYEDIMRVFREGLEFMFEARG